MSPRSSYVERIHMFSLHWSVIFYVLLIDTLALMSPGPDFFMVLKNSLNKSHKAGIYTALGIALGCAILFTLSIFGVGVLIAQNKILFMTLKIAGSLYLIYLAIKSILAKSEVKEPQLVSKENIKVSIDEYFKIGLICNLTNPKALMFVIAVSTYLVQNGNPYTDGFVVIICTTIATVIWFSLVSIIFGSIKVRKVFYRYQRIINILFGLVLLYMAIKIIFM